MSKSIDHSPNESTLVTKLHVPPARAKQVSRPRLIARLNEGLTRKLTLISASAGTGKTTLLTEWQMSLDPNHVSLAWVSLDEHDDALARFWTYVIAALQTIQPRIGASARLSLDSISLPNLPRTRDERVWMESALISFINDLAAISTDIALVLDDYHSIESPIIHDSVAFLLDHLPVNAHLIIASREDPPLALARLRALDQLIELRSADLRFNTTEVIAFFEGVMGMPLAQPDASAIQARTEGWVAGLQMAALALRDQNDPTKFIASFTGNHHFVMDYLFSQVLQKQPPDIQSFLLQTAILDRMNGALCDAVTGRTDSQTLLEKLDASNLFIVPLDAERRWYRYHQLFADLLRHRQSLLPFDQLTILHQRASIWHEQADDWFNAVNHAVAAKDWERTARLLEQTVQNNRLPWMYGEVNRVARWLDTMPPELVRARPRLSLVAAWTQLLGNQFTHARQQLDIATQVLATIRDKGEARTIHGQVLAIRIFLAIMRGDMTQIISAAQQALELLPEQETLLQSIVALSLADAYYYVSYDAQAAQKAYSQALVWGEATDNHAIALMALSGLAGLMHTQGRLRETERLLRRTIALADSWGGRDFFSMSQVHWILGWIEYWWDHVDTAVTHMQTSLQIARQWKFPLLSVYACGALATMKQARGDDVGASELLRQAELVVQESPASAFEATMLAYYRLWIWTSQGNLPAALQLIHEHESEWGDKTSRTYALLMRAVTRTFLMQGRATSDSILTQRALELLQQVLPQSEAMGLEGDVIVNLMLQALAYQDLGQSRQAVRTLVRALTLAEPEGYIRIFVDFGEPIARLLVDVAEHEPRLQPYASKLLAHFDTTTSDKLIEPLTERELDVLRLVASGAADQEIAEQLIVSKSTVKTHLRNIYGKLQVKNRTQALVRARTLRLLQ